MFNHCSCACVCVFLCVLVSVRDEFSNPATVPMRVFVCHEFSLPNWLHNAALVLHAGATGSGTGTGAGLSVLRYGSVGLLAFLLLFLFLLLLCVQLKRDGARLLHVEQLLEQLGDIVIGFGRCLHEGYAPGGRLRLPLHLRHFTQLGALIALIAHQHNGNRVDIALQITRAIIQRLYPSISIRCLPLAL